MVDLLVFIHLFIYVVLDTLARPLNVPLVTLSLIHAICFEHSLHKSSVSFDHLKEHVEL